MARVTDDRFDDILNLNNSSGNLEFDDETHQLNLVVQKNMHDTNSQTKDVKALRYVCRHMQGIMIVLLRNILTCECLYLYKND